MTRVSQTAKTLRRNYDTAFLTNIVGDTGQFWHFRGQNCQHIPFCHCYSVEKDKSDLQSHMTNSTNNLPLVRLSSINPFLLELSRQRVDTGAMLRELGLPTDVPASSEFFVSAAAIYEFVEKTAEVAGDPYFGFRIGEGLDLGAWEPIALAVAKSNTVGELLNHFVVDALDHSSSTRFYLRSEGDRSTFGFSRLVKPALLPAQNDAFYFGFLSRMLLHATQDNWDPSLVLFRVADPEALPRLSTELRIIKGCDCGIQVSFPTDWLFEPFRKSAFQSDAAEFDISRPPESLVASVHHALVPHIHMSNLTVARAAEICGYSRHRLSRQLRETGTTLTQEIAKLRAERARKDLGQSDRRISDIALSVGFKDPTVFSRAFKNWTGQSPQEYRRTHR
jgi:AraC-like DNA-binding protein